MIISRVNDLVMLLPVLVGVVAILRYCLYGGRYTVKNMRLNAKRIKKRAILLLAVLAAYAACWSVTWVADFRQNPYCVVSFNYPAASQGLNPNGTKFTVSEMTGDEILGPVIERSGLVGISTEDLRGSLEIRPVRHDEEVSLEQPYINTEYTVQFKKNKDTASVDAEAVLSTYVSVFENWFSNEYSRKTSLLTMDFEGLSEADYLDIGKILDSKASTLQSFMSGCREENSSYQSVKTGESFGSLEKKISNFREVALENYNAFVLENGLSKSPEQYAGKLNYDNQLLNVDYLKNQSYYQIYLEAINMYDRDMASVVLIPTRDETGEFYMSRTKIGVDNFSSQANQAIENLKELSSEIEDNSYAAVQIENSVQSEEAASKAEEMIESLKSQLMSLSEAAIETVTEYDSESYLAVNGPDVLDMVKECVFKCLILTGVLLAAVLAWNLGAPLKEDDRGDSHETV